MSRAPVLAARVPAPTQSRSRAKPAHAKPAPAPSKPARLAPAPHAAAYSLASIPVLASSRDGRPHEDAVQRVDLPFRLELEREFGQPLDHLIVLTGDPVAAWLSDVDAVAACAGDVILLADPAASAITVAHEVVHALQGDAAPPALTSPGSPLASRDLIGAHDPAEAEAATLARDPSPAPVEQSLPAGVVALRRANIPTTPSPSEPTDEDTFERGLDKAAAPAPDTAEPDAETPDLPAEATETAGAVRATEGAVPDEAPAPTFELEPMPDTALSGEEQAARKAEADAAAAAIAQADNPSGVIGAYADAPPTVKAATQSMIGGRITDVVATDQQEFAANLPEFHATMTGGEPVEPVAEVAEAAAPVAEPLVLEAEAPAPAPEPDLPPVPEPEPYTENNEVVSFLRSIFGLDAADAIARALGSVETTDPGIETTAGERPAVPLEGETDPARIDEQQRAGEEQARIQKEAATTAVLKGRGPEQAQLREMDELVPTAELPVPAPNELAGSPEADQLTQMALPEEVLAQFDKDLGATMQASLEEARGQVGQAEIDRDTQRSEAVATAEQQRDDAIAEADGQQKADVQTARESIETARQTSIDGQEAAVAQLEVDAEQARGEQQLAIETRVAADEETIAGKYDQAEIDAQAKVTQGEQDAEAERVKAEKEAEDESWWDAAVSFVEDVFDALTSLISDIFDKVRSAVKDILDTVREAAKGLIDLAADFVKGAIAAYGEALKVLVDATVGQVFPELAADLNAGIDGAVATATAAVDAVADTLKAGIDYVVDTLNKAINFVIDMYQAALNMALAFMEAAITGDWSKLALKVLESVLRILGIDPAAFYAFIAQIVDTVNLILDDPLGFLSNLVNAVVLGFQKFADNFLTHLQVGIIAWLTGALGGIQIPAEFNLIGVLDLARQILGLTYEWVREKAVRLVGEENVARIEFVLSYVKTLFEGGFAALWERITQDLGGLVDSVLGAIKTFLVEKVIIASITWIASLFSPVGALVKLVFTIWNLYTFVRDQLARIIQIAQTIVEGLANIAHGVIENAALRVESALANLLPVAIDLVAKLLGLTGVTAKVRQIIEDIRSWIDNAVNKLLDKVLQAFTGKGEPAVPGGAEGAVESGVGENLAVDGGDGTQHHLTIAVAGTNATAMLQSEKLPVSTWLDKFDAQAAAMATETVEQKAAKKTAEEKIKAARVALGELDPEVDAVVAAQAGGGKAPEDTKREVSVDQDKLRDALVEVFRLFGGKGAPILGVFGAEIEKAHKLARPHIKALLEEHSTTFQTMAWPDVRADIATKHDLFVKPFLAEHAFGREAQAIAKEAKILSDELSSSREVTEFFQHWLVERTHTDKAAEFVAAREALRAVLFEGGEVSAAGPALTAAVAAALAIKAAAGEGADPDLKAAASEDIIGFLVAVARKKEEFNKLSLADWEDRLWGKPNNREWIEGRFRAKASGKHEWILTHMIDEVVARTRDSADPDALPAGATWLELQHALRTPTKVLILPTTYARPISELRDPKARTPMPGVSGLVLQGHIGAVYAPIEKGGYRESVAPQTEGSKGWHDRLEAIFTTNPGSDLTTMRTVVRKIDEFWPEHVWSGDTSGLVFDEYYKSKRTLADGEEMTSLTELAAVGQGARKEIETNFDTARKAVGL